MNKYKTTINKIENIIVQLIQSKNEQRSQTIRFQAIKEYENMLKDVDITDYLLLDSKPELPRELFLESYFKLGTLYKNCCEHEIQKYITEFKKNKYDQNTSTLNSEPNFTLFQKAIECFVNILRVEFEDKNAIKQIVSINTQMTFVLQNDPQKCIKLIHDALFFDSTNPVLHYNLAFLFQKINNLENSLIHYKLSMELCKSSNLPKEEKNKNLVNCLNGITSIFRSIKQWPEALHYLLKAEQILPLDPDIQNQLGVVYTEMRRTDLAEKSYNKAIKNYQKSFVSSDFNFLLSEIYLNYGHMHSYNGDNQKSIDCYNKALQISPHFSLPFQNKIMNLSYIFDELQDKMYILNQHKLVNKLYKKGLHKFDSTFFKTEKINIGIISGDFVDHPVSFFIRPLLKNFDPELFNITCYSECVINTQLFNPLLNFKIIKNYSAQQAAKLIYDDRIHILLDLAGHTAFNRLDVFALKPSPIQISYIGYPYSTGLTEMDYRITDSICDNSEVSQKFYTEKLLYLDNCFLCYDPTTVRKNLLQEKISLKSQPKLKNNYITIGCFNRVNKITDNVIKIFNDILVKFKNVKFIFKTKALLNNNIKLTFLEKFDKSVRNRISVLDCTILHEGHLDEYNKIDIAIDTFPYSGTTTSCESLYMGVPVYTIYDKEYYFHPQNVTASILHNSDLQDYIVDSKEQLFSKIEELHHKNDNFWENLKPHIRNKFLNGKVCDQKLYINNISTMFDNLFSNAKNKYN